MCYHGFDMVQQSIAWLTMCSQGVDFVQQSFAKLSSQSANYVQSRCWQSAVGQCWQRTFTQFIFRSADIVKTKWTNSWSQLATASADKCKPQFWSAKIDINSSNFGLVPQWVYKAVTTVDLRPPKQTTAVVVVAVVVKPLPHSSGITDSSELY